jgi:hypothetical protein
MSQHDSSARRFDIADPLCLLSEHRDDVTLAAVLGDDDGERSHLTGSASGDGQRDNH